MAGHVQANNPGVAEAIEASWTGDNPSGSRQCRAIGSSGRGQQQDAKSLLDQLEGLVLPALDPSFTVFLWNTRTGPDAPACPDSNGPGLPSPSPSSSSRSCSPPARCRGTRRCPFSRRDARAAHALSAGEEPGAPFRGCRGRYDCPHGHREPGRSQRDTGYRPGNWKHRSRAIPPPWQVYASSIPGIIPSARTAATALTGTRPSGSCRG